MFVLFPYSEHYSAAFDFWCKAVKEHQSSANAQKGVQGESFSLMFHNPRGVKINGSQTDFNRGALGTFRLLITPVGLEPNYCEAVINHLRR